MNRKGHSHRATLPLRGLIAVWVFCLCIFATYIEVLYYEKTYSNPHKETIFRAKDKINEKTEMSEKGHLHYLSNDEPYSSRMLEIQDKCSTIDHRIYSPIRTDSMKYNDKIKLVMCEVPKVASTTWQMLLLNLGGYTKKVTQKQIDRGEIPNKHFDLLTTDAEAEQRMKEYVTFFVTRHPFERLVSAYLDKLTNKSEPTLYRRKYGKVIARDQAHFYMHGINVNSKMIENRGEIRKLSSFKKLTASGKQDVLQYLEIMRTGEISFEQFVNYLISFDTAEKAKDMDKHWRPQTYLCMPCAYNYSYVIRFENLSVESNRLIDYLQMHQHASKSVKRFPEGKSTVRNEVTAKTFRTIKESQVQELRKIYSDDFYILNHDPYLYKGVV